MDRLLPILRSEAPAQTCVWMDAGVIAFRLCDRGFACDHCPFDAAVRRDPRAAIQGDAPEARPAPPLAAWAFPPDRLYTSGHLWVQVIRDGRVRTGIDACGARLVRGVQQVRASPWPDELKRDELLCVLVVDRGELPIGAPVAGRPCRWNEALESRPALIGSEPYSGGWLAELDMTRPAELDTLQRAAETQRRAMLDARLFRREVAFHLLSTEPSGPEPGLDGEFLEASARLVGPGSLAEMTGRILH
jgi:glycine cleavage system H protein